MKKTLICLFLGLITTAFPWALKTGTYNLTGSSANNGRTYHGQVIIAPQGQNYQVIWKVGNSQTQVGVGIYRDWEDVLSVAYLDLDTRVWGVASFKVGAYGELEGKWTTAEGTNQGTEYLTWQNSFLY